MYNVHEIINKFFWEVQMETIKINTLGDFTISYKGRHISDSIVRTKKIWAFLQYLVQNKDRRVPEGEFVRALWQNGNSTNPANALKTLLFRVRGVLEELGFPHTKELIMHRQGCYFFNTKFKIVVDYEQFTTMLGTQNKSDKTRFATLTKAINLYKGIYLQNSEVSPWVTQKRKELHDVYLDAVREIIELYRAEGMIDEIVELCKTSAEIDPYNENVQIMYIKSLSEAKFTGDAIKHYEYVTDLFFSKLGESPSQEFTRLYREITKSENIFEPDLTIIREGLETPNENAGAIFCEYEMFREYYSITATSASRFDIEAHLCLFTVSAEGASLKTLNTVMEKLFTAIGSSLRHSDIYTRYSVTQYLVFISGSNYENGSTVANRILSAFKKMSFRKNVKVEYSLRPMVPIDNRRTDDSTDQSSR